MYVMGLSLSIVIMLCLCFVSYRKFACSRLFSICFVVSGTFSGTRGRQVLLFVGWQVLVFVGWQVLVGGWQVLVGVVG